MGQPCDSQTNHSLQAYKKRIQNSSELAHDIQKQIKSTFNIHWQNFQTNKQLI